MGVYTQWQPGMRVTAARLNAATPTLTDYTPTWGATTTSPVVGNGTLTGRWARVDNLVWFTINMATGSTTTYGGGSYSWSLPVASGPGMITPVQARLAIGGGSTYALVGQVGASDSSARFFASFGTGAASISMPATWTSGTTIVISGVYPAA